VKNQQMQQLFIQFINYAWYLLHVSALHCHPQGAFLVPSETCPIEEQSTEYCGWTMLHLLDFHAHINEMHGSRSKIHGKKSHQAALRGGIFNSCVKGLIKPCGTEATTNSDICRLRSGNINCVLMSRGREKKPHKQQIYKKT
jgi:hypothetical protein